MSEYLLRGEMTFWPVAVWQCCGCGIVETRTLYQGFTLYQPPDIHSCSTYSYGVFEPLNNVARHLTQGHLAMLKERESIRAILEEELKNWPPAPGFRWYWETRRE